MNELIKNVKENTLFLLEFLAIIVAIFVIAYLVERLVNRKNNYEGRVLTTRKIAVIGMFSAISAILMVLEIPVIFAPSFYKFDFSELPALIGAFAFGPVAGVMIEFVKILIKLLLKGTSSAFVGELANFVVGCALVLPASIIYLARKNKKTAIVACIAGTACMTVIGSVFNAVYLLPKFAEMYGMPMDALIAMGTAVNSPITSLQTFIILAVAPLNLIKGGVVSLITILIYKKLSPILKGNHS